MGEIRDAEHVRQAPTDGLPIRVVVQEHLDAAHEDPYFPDAGALGGGPDIPGEARHEPGTVVPLERDLLVVNDDRVHSAFSMARISSAAKCPLRAALSIVPGSPVSVQSPASTRPRMPVRFEGRSG